MALVLCIDTAGETAVVGLGNEEGVIASEVNSDQKNHAGFVQPAIKRILSSASLSFADVSAVAVVNGPGSYTGLRVGLSTAKGICYASGKPLIALNTLTVMAFAAVEYFEETDVFYCPLIDARRNEVFTAVYNYELLALLPPQPLIVEPDSFNIYLDKQKTIFFGSGHNKCGTIISHENALFTDINYSVNHICKLSLAAYHDGTFADTAYLEPYYTKDFFSAG